MMIVRHNNKRKYAYRAFGLDINSEIFLPELLSSENIGDINIFLGKVPSEITHIITKGPNYQVSQNQLVFSIQGVARYFIANGNSIIIEPDVRGDETSIKLYLLGTAMGALLLQRGILPIHGSSVAIDKYCIIFTGVSGAGKSTLASAFRKSGCSFLSDDVSTVILSQDGIPWVQPGYPQQKLCRDSAENMGYDTGSLKLVDAQTDKYAVPVHNDFLCSQVRLAAVCELSPEGRNDVEMCQVFGAERLKVLLKNIYRVELLKWFWHQGKLHGQCMDLAKDVAFFRLVRPRETFLLEDQVNVVKDKMRSLLHK